MVSNTIIPVATTGTNNSLYGVTKFVKIGAANLIEHETRYTAFGPYDTGEAEDAYTNTMVLCGRGLGANFLF